LNDLDKSLEPIRKAFNVPLRNLAADPLVEALPEPLYVLHSKFSSLADTGVTVRAAAGPTLTISIDSEQLIFSSVSPAEASQAVSESLADEFGQNWSAELSGVVPASKPDLSAQSVVSLVRKVLKVSSGFSAERLRILKSPDSLEIAGWRVLADPLGVGALKVRLSRTGENLEIILSPKLYSFQVQISRSVNGKSASSAGEGPVDPALASLAARAATSASFTEAVAVIAQSQF
jgi:hypothetical protein